MSHDVDAVLGRVERVVAQAMARGADQAEVYWTRDVGLDMDVENNALQSTGRSRNEGGAIRLIKDGRLGFAYFTAEDQAEKAIAQALALSRLSPAKGLELPGPEDMPMLAPRWDDDIAALDVAEVLGLAQDMLAARPDDVQIAGGGVHFGWSIEALANSQGVACVDRTTGASLGVNLVMQDGDRAINAWDSESVHLGRPDGAAIVERVAADLRSLRAPVASEGGSKDVIFRPDAASELVTGLIMSAVDGDDALRGKSVWSDRLGDTVADARFSLIDDPLREGALGVAPFDGDGLPSRRLPIIEDGVLRNFMFDIRDGNEHGQPSTHSAVRAGFKSLPGVGSQHVVIEGKAARPDAAIIADVDDGYLVESVLGAHTANATTGDFSITAPNVWRIRGGEVVGAAAEIAIGGNLPELLHRLDGIGAEPKRMDGAMVPMLRFRGVPVSA